MPLQGFQQAVALRTATRDHHPFFLEWKGKRHGYLLDVMLSNLPLRLISPKDVLIPIPSQKEPGSAGVIAEALSTRTGAKIAQLLCPLPRPKQSALPSAFDRVFQGKQRFGATTFPQAVSPHSQAWIVDDLWTTGTSLMHAADLLSVIRPDLTLHALSLFFRDSSDYAR